MCPFYQIKEINDACDILNLRLIKLLIPLFISGTREIIRLDIMTFLTLTKVECWKLQSWETSCPDSFWLINFWPKTKFEKKIVLIFVLSFSWEITEPCRQ